MEVIKLIKPTKEYYEELKAYQDEIINTDGDFSGCSFSKDTDMMKWFDFVASLENEETCPKEYVSATVFLVIRESDQALVGTTDFRHTLGTPILFEWGGNIGYSVRPKERRKGYGSQLLKLVLEKCREYGLHRVLISCKMTNKASEKIIIKNKGSFDKVTTDGSALVKRFWIIL